jgi:hypothetical protein
MAINRRSAQKTDAGEAFIARAEPGKPRRWQRGNRTQITLSIAPKLLEQLDAVAQEQEITRAALLAQWIRERLSQRAA